MSKLIHAIKRFICKRRGHDWEIYTFRPEGAYWSWDVEKAGHCKRCGYDTHGKWEG